MRVLIVDEQKEDRDRIKYLLQGALDPLECVEAGDAAAYGQALDDGEIELVLTEAVLGWTTGLAVFRDVRTRARGVPVIMVTGSGSETLAVDALKAGLADYVPKDHLERLVPAIRSAAEHALLEQALEQSRQSLAAELDITRRIQEVSTRLIQADEIDTLYQEILDTTMAILHADFGSIQVFRPERGDMGELQLIGQRGFNPEAAEFWSWVRPDSDSTCGMALRTRQRVSAPDIRNCDFMAGTEDQAVYLQNGIRAAQTTPLLSRSGHLLGMLSTHWRLPYDPTRSELRALDILARLAADLIQRRRAEQALRESEERYRRLFESIDEGFCVIEVLFDDAETAVDYRFVEVNPAFKRQVGIANAVGRRMREIAPDHEDHWFQTYGRVARTGEAVRFQNHAAAFDGFYDVYAFRVGEPEQRRVAVLFTDITERKRAEDQLRRYTAELEQLNEANQLLLGEVNHRVKNSLTAILSLIFAEQQRLKVDEAMNGGLPRCQTALNDLSERVRNLATVHGLLASGQWRPLRADLLVGELIRESLPAGVDPRRLRLTITGEPVLLSPQQAHHLALVVGELAMNTAKHREGQEAFHIAVDLKLEDGEVRLTYRSHDSRYPDRVLDGKDHSVGLGLVKTLTTHSLRGSWSIRNDEGAVTEIRFPISHPNPNGWRTGQHH